ncbi:TPA: hypothetical protein DD448_00215 [Candidatus Collierbacteria bacterium]|nr:hypothetical protein [Candidatus Collierbacteria bacterium]
MVQAQDPARAMWGYFDGTHYLRLAEFGYVDVGTQAFFPLYPAFISIFGRLLHLSYFPVAIAVSLVTLTLSLVVIAYLWPRSRWWVTMVILLFPTAFYWGTIYTESLFLFLSLLFFLLLKRKSYWAAAVVAGLSSATRLVGVFLALALIVEVVTKRRLWRSAKPSDVVYLIFISLLSLSGFLFYMAFLNFRFGDPLMFLHVQTLFGAERSSDRLILLPQVLYRYLQMILTVDPTTWVYQKIWLEIITFLGALALLFTQFRRHSAALLAYLLASLLLPTLTGTLSSVPRYVLVLLPYLSVPITANKWARYGWVVFSTGFLIYLFRQYVGGAFVA